MDYSTAIPVCEKQDQEVVAEPDYSLAENLRRIGSALEDTKCMLRDILLNLRGRTPTGADAPPRTNPETMIQHASFLLETAYTNADMARIIRIALIGDEPQK